ncbi:MAG: DegT/DnrJ/EryC1/StrS family aminotransferase [Candidatus Aenigmatarchaeota archaeon]
MISISSPLIDDEEKKAVNQVLDSHMLVQGKKVQEFEDSFAEYIGVQHAVATNNGTTALELSFRSAGLKNGEVITTPFSFIASANSILYTGAKPVFADIDSKTFNINPELIEEKITDKTKAILPVHLYGQSCDMKHIMEIAEKHNLIVIEDSCQAHGAEYNGKRTGSFGTGCFSFYATKNMTTGEGGIITTNNKEIADTARILRNHGQEKRYYHKVLGYNYRMTDIAAAIGIAQLRKLDQINKKRIENAKKLNDELSDIKGLITPEIITGNKHIFHQYTLRITDNFPKTRNEFAEILTKNGIGSLIYYPVPIHMQEVYKKLGYIDSLPVSEKMAREVISIPVHPKLSEDDIRKIVDVIRSIK